MNRQKRGTKTIRPFLRERAQVKEIQAERAREAIQKYKREETQWNWVSVCLDNAEMIL